MPTTYKDFRFELGDYAELSEYTGSSAMVLAIKNILLSRPGNFPFHPSLGMDIFKYQFDLLDDTTISDITTELNRQVSIYMPNLEDIDVKIQKVEPEDGGETYLGIAISSTMNGELVTADFLASRDRDVVYVFDEVRK